MDYVFMTDSSCDLTPELISEVGVEVIPMEFHMEGKSYLHYPNCRMMKLDEFYKKLKNGADSKTSQINYDTFTRYFETYLKAGKDVLYTGISTGLSGTYNTCMMAAKDLGEKYPDRKIVVIDSLCDSAGLGYLVYIAGQKYKDGASIEDIAQFIEETRLKLCHWFVVEDLDQLKRGGRISSVSATFGKALQIKPLISVDDGGRLINVAKIRGKSNIIPTLIKYVERDSENLKDSIVFVAHADNMEGAIQLKKQIKGKCQKVYICDIGPVIGSHVGSGMLAILFMGKRNLKP